MFKWRFIKKTTAFSLWAFTSMLVGAFVLATIDRTAITTEEMIVVPGSVHSTAWVGFNESLISDLDDESIYHEFSPSNAAYFDESVLLQPAGEAPVTNPDISSDDLVPDTATDAGQEPGATEVDPDTTTEPDTTMPPDQPADSSEAGEASEESSSSPEPVPVVDVAEPSQETPPQPEPTSEPEASVDPAPAEVVSSADWGVFPYAVKRYPLVQEVITTYVTTSEAISEELEPLPEVIDVEIVPEETTEEEVISETLPDEELVESDVEIAGEEVFEETSEDVSSNEVEEVSEIIEETVEEVNEEEEFFSSPLDVCAGYDNCKMYPVTFDGFAIPEFESGKFLSDVTLRLSLAAQADEDHGPQQFVIEYRYDSVSPWRSATVIDINDETSNGLNGGYFLVSLDRPLNQSDLATLEVQVSYLGDVRGLKRAYVESLWLEVSASSFYEESDPYFNKDALLYTRDLELPQLHELLSEDLDVSAEELPVFMMEYSPQQNILKRLATALFSENVYSVEGVRVIDASGAVVNVPIDITYYDNQTWSLAFLKQPQKMLPGKYRLEVTVNENDTLYIDSFEFYWGVLAVNTTKGRYFAGDEVVLNLAALNEEGNTICDAILELTIIGADNTIYEVSVEQSGACDKNNVTDIPDYLAYFKDTSQYGQYTIQLRHLNTDGAVVHKIENHFTVEEYIPYVIERTAPTRIYPPAPYDVSLKITANRAYTGDIVEYVPRGFVISEAGEAEFETLSEYSRLIWRNVILEEGDELTLSYTFDAPDISPYLYLLGPLDMDGFTELRPWQIASDAITAVGWLTGTRTVAGTNLNQAASPLQWSTSSLDTFYFNHATSSNSHELTIRQAGDYFLAVNVPHQRTDANARSTRIGLAVRVNGVALPEGVGRSGYISNQSGHGESSSHAFFMLDDVDVDDVVTVNVEGLTTINAADVVNMTGSASLYLEYLPPDVGVFTATTTRTTNSTNLNQTTEYAFQWIETRQDTGFVHSDSVNSEQIILSDPGVYLVQANIPLNSDTNNTNILGQVRLDGALVSGGQFKQGFGQAPGTESDPDSSIHFSGIVVATTTNQVLTLTATREGNTGTIVVPTGVVGSVFVRELPSSDLIALRGTAVVGGTNWNPAAAAAIQWSTGIAKDTAIFTHSTSSNTHQITIASNGDYYLSYNDALNGTVARANSRVQVLKNGAAISGAQTKSHYIRNQNAHTESSAALVFALEGLVNGDIITVTTQQEAAAGTLDDTTAATLLIWKKQTFNQRPDAPSMYNAPFDNIRFASTTPYFDFSAVDPDGTRDIEYEFSISTSSSFSASSTYLSSVDNEFSNTASTTDTSPFIEGNKIRFQLTTGDALTDQITYYWRVRAKDVSGSGEFGDWSTTQSLTIDMSAPAPSWYQSYSGQFEGDSLVGTVSSGADRIQVDETVSSEVLLVYGEGTVTTPRYRFWNGVSWGVEGSAQAVTNTINWTRTAAGVSRDEYVLVTLDAANDAYAQVYSASTSSWGNQKLLSSVVVSAAYRGIAVGYESISGDAMAVSCTDSPDPVYSIWNGTTWSATSTINATSLNNCNFLEIASDPSSDEMILIVRDTGTQYEALVWDGSAWVESRVIGSSALVAREGLSVAYEASGDQAIIVVSNGINNSFAYTTWNGTEFSTNATQAIGDDFEFGQLTADTDSDKVSLCYIDTDNDVGVITWNGGTWPAATTELDVDGNIDTGRPIECAYETLAGRGDYLHAVYSDTLNVRYRTATSTIWTAEATVGSMEDSYWVQVERAGDGQLLVVTLEDTIDDIEASTWNGSTWSAKQTLETSPSSVIAAPYEMYDLTAKRFQFSEGVATTPPIDFTAVPNQPTWGDVNFSTDEPFGTDVQVRILYTSTTTCDAYIPDGALPGNSTGFDVSQSPIDLTALSTSTYDQICLEATLTTLGSGSAALEEWTLAWVRQPKLTQSNYRWYVNGSFLTPTDPWPAGANDVDENMALSSNQAVDVNEAIRLRLSLQGTNVALPAFSEAFKLQYAEGLTCAPSLSWADVGGPASTTAIWRGFENSIVGDDWYSANWSRRVKLTISNSVVEDGVTDFPVYVNLADLPSSFFSSVQSDGDDIRITEVDGVTELPFELAGINTGLETGELHFKADLSTSTDSEFYLYYGNGSASGYAVTATYGARNVWTNGYSLRYALDDSPAAASPQFKDSTSNNNNAVAYAGMTAGDVVAGKLGQAIDLDGNDGGTFQSALAYAGTFTASMWWNSAGDGYAIAGPAGANEKLGPWSSPADQMFVRTVSSSDTTVANPADGTWSYIALTRDSSNKVDLHINGSTTRLYADVAQAGTSDWINFGGETTQGFLGLLDELRFSTARRSDGWIRTEFSNQSNPTGFYAVSAEELISDGRVLPSTVLVDSDLAETYEEENPTPENKNSIPVGDDAEWDFVLNNNGATSNTNYCFRLVYEDGALLNSYQNYPRLITNAAPLTPVLTAPFDNELLASTTPWFEFSADDELDDEVAYQIQVSTDAAFGSTVIDSDSVSNFALYTNLSQPSQKSTFTAGQTIQFIPTSALTNGNTYWWRVRAWDPDGSNDYSEWTTPESFTINTGTVITTWFQTTGDQFATNNLQDAIANLGANDTGIDSGFTVATTTSTAIDYDDRDVGNAWGEFSFTNNVTSGSIRYYIEYRVSGDTFALIPDTALTGNSAGFTSSPVSLVSLDTTLYNEIRIVAVLSGNSTLPRLQDWTVTWSEKIEVPTLMTPFDNAKNATATPSFTFTTTDPEADAIQYEVQISSSDVFTSSSTFTSGVDAGFSNVDDVGDTSPFTSGDTIQYTVQSALTNGNTYWWRARARDPGGSNTWSSYSSPRSFTIDTSITTSMWHQTTGEQFATNETVSIATSSGAAAVTSTIQEVMAIYAEGTGQSPQYRLWNGASWSVADSAQSVSSQIRWLELAASPSLPEYALGTLGTDLDVNFQIYDASAGTWGNVFEMQTNSVASNKRTFNLAYESQSGDLLAVACNGVDALYATWNGVSWSATSSLNLANANNCEYIAIAADPTTDEITAVFRHTNTGTSDFEALVWNGSAWGNSLTFGNLDGSGNEGMAVVYEESGGQAIVAVSNSPNTTLLYGLWSGSAWSTSTHALGDMIEWATLKADDGSDRIALCYQDNDLDLGVLFWDGSGWGTNTELDIDGNDDTGRAIDCEFETSGARDGYLMVTYSDTIGTRYQSFSSSTSTPSGEVSLDVITDTFEDTLVRAGDGRLHFAGYDDALTPDRIDHTRWNGSTWTARERFSDNASLNGVTPYVGGVSLAAQIYPNILEGSLRSTPINFADGSGPRWDYVSWNDSTPGTSLIEYRMYYESAPGVYSLVPNAVLPGNSAGFTTSPIDISGVNRTTYSVLQLDAQLLCDAGDCPSLNDWTVAWSEGVTVSGVAREYDGVSTTTSGTVAVAVNGVLQSGKTGTINGSGVWSISNVTVFPDDTVTVFVDGAAEASEAVAIATYNGTGNVTGLELTKRHVTIGGTSAATTTTAGFAGYDFVDDEDLFFTVGGSHQLTVCADSSCGDAVLKVLAGTAYVPGATVTTINLRNNGTFAPATNTIRVAGSWNNQGTFTEGTSQVIFTATSSSFSLTTASTSHRFYNVTFGETSGGATWTLGASLAVLGNLAIDYGTLARGTSSLALSGNLSIGVSGGVSGLATTTFTGTGSYTWGDAKATTSSSNIGYVVVDGVTKTITLSGSVAAESVTIGSDDTLNSSGSGYTLSVYRGWVNNNSFVPQNGTVAFIGTSTSVISRGTSAFNNLAFYGTGAWSFATATLAINGNLTIATGTVTLPTGTTTIAGSFANTGTFLHNNGEVRMTSSVAGRTITQSGTAFLNAFYDLVFTGSGAWSFTETHATTSRDFKIQAGAVTFPSGTLTVGGDMLVTGAGSFSNNSGELILLVQDVDAVRTNGGTLNNLRIVGGFGPTYSRSFADTNMTVAGNLVLTAAGTSTFPTGVLSVGGSFANDGVFTASGGTVRFNSTAGSETVDAGNSSFATLEFTSATGDFTLVDHATATVAINLTSAVQFTVASGASLAAGGSFTQSVLAANTTWSGSTLRFYSGGTVNTNVKTHGGDTYGTLESTNNTLVKLWNSSAATYVTTGTTSAIYSQDHAGLDGDLTIYGNYRRSSGTEYWSSATDFDGTALGTSSRQVDVRMGNGSVVTIATSSLEIVGSAIASTTISAVSGSYDLVVSGGTVVAENFTASGLAASGLQLLASTTLTTMRAAALSVVPGRTGITIDTSTIDTNASAQFTNFNFSTSSAGAASNVTKTGAATNNFVWFRNGTGDLYGEAYDAGDGDPGSVRFDDSSYLITVSGVVYSDAGTTPMGAPVCDGATPNVRLVVDGGSYTDAVSCAAGTGAFTFSNVAYVGDPVIVVYLNTNGGTQGSVVTKTPTTNITNLNIYANRVIVRHEDVAPLSIADMVGYDFADDADIAFTATLGAPNTLTTREQTELYVFASSTFTPGGNITLGGNGNSNSYEGTLALGVGSTFTATGTEIHTLAGRFVAESSATFTAASSTIVFTATTTGKSITSTGGFTFNNLTFNGLGGGWNIGADLTVLGDMQVATGTVTGTGNITVLNGSLYGNGVLSLGSGTTTIARTNTLGGTSAWTFNNLILGNGTVVGTTTRSNQATTTILGRLTIANAHYLSAGSSVWDLAGTGTVLVETGTLLEGTSTIRYSGAGATVLSTTYHNLVLDAGVGSATYTATGSGVLVNGNLTVGGTATTNFNLNTNDVLTQVVGDVRIMSNGTLEASNSTNLLVSGSWNNDGAFTASGGMVRFTPTSPVSIAAGNSAFATVEVDGSGDITLSEHATATVAWRLIGHGMFTVSSGQSLAVGGEFLNNIGGASTEFTGSTVSLYGVGTYDINDAATSESYNILTVASGTQARVWNTTAATYGVATGGSLYSQDHAGADGDLYIYGQLVRTVGDDYWSYDTDFDGTDLSGGSEREAHVYFASGASALWTGGSLSVMGTSTGSTTLQNQGSGTYGLTVGGTATTEWRNASIRDIDMTGINFTGTPTVTNFTFTDHLVAINNATAITVAGSVIDQNPAKNFTNNYFAQSGGVTTPKNVTATGSTVSSWRFTNHSGNIAGEAFDSDPTGDPGYLVWDDSAALITVAGNVYSDEGVTVSSVCDGSTNNVRLVVAGLTTYDTSCNASTGAYSISNVAFGPVDTLVLYINDETPKAANVTVSPISSISNMHLYENRVIVRHENTSPLTIADMAIWDSSDDADIPYTATDAGSDTLVLPANYKLLVWSSKTFAPAGAVTLSGGGGGAAYDGTLEVQANATFRAVGTETHSVGGSVIMGTGATYTAASSTLVLTTTGAARTLDVNANTLHNVSVTGSGSWTVTDPTLTLTGSYTQSAGTLTLPTGTTTVAAAFNVTGGTVVANTTPFVFTATSAGNAVRFNGALVGSLSFTGTGSWSMNDTNATTTGSVTVSRGTLTLPSGSFAVGQNFLNTGGAITHNTSDIVMTATSSATLLASSSDLFAVRFVGPASYTLLDNSVTLIDSFEVASGSVSIGTGTLAVGGSFTATGGTFTHASGTVLLNASAVGKVVNPGISAFYNLQFGAPSGGYTLYSATTTNNLTIASVSSLTVNPTAQVTVFGVFLNSVGGAATTWTNTTLKLLNPSGYSINTRTGSGDVYGTLEIGASADVRMWYSSAATTTVATSSSLYSQDHNAVNGALYIYGDFTIATTTEYWSYATDFDGTSLTGTERAVTVSLAPYATTTVISGTLSIAGVSGNETVIQNQVASSTHALRVTGGTLSANWYEMYQLGLDGLELSGLATISNLANGYFEIAVDTGSLITLSSTTLNANPSKIFDNVGFSATGSISGYNVELVGETTNAWRFTNNYGSIGDEGFDIDGLDACGSIRFDDSSCLLTEQTHIRWRADDGGEGAPNDEWFDLDWDYRKRVRVLNNDNQAYASTAVKVAVSYDSNMQANFADLRFTSADGVTEIPFWVERYTASTDALVWVRVPTLPASEYATVFMYYGNGTASSTSSGTSTFATFDDFEDNSLSEYSGDTTLFTTVTSPVYGGSYALGGNPVSGKTTDGIFRFDTSVAQGQMLRYMQYVNAGVAGNNDEPCTLFGVQSPGTTNQNYAVCLERFGTDRISLAKDVDNNDVSGTVLATTTVTYSTGWYEVEIDWRTNNQIVVSLYTSAGTLVASTTATDSSYTTGGFGYAYWYQNGAWDSFTARPRVATRPTVYTGSEQTFGGASWLSLLDSAGTAIPGNIVRLRLAIENSGLAITDQQFRLEYAAKGGAPTCESVSGGTFAQVPNQASCGTSPVCMATSSNVTNGVVTTDLLFSTNGTYTAGELITSPSSETAAIDIDQDYYTEVEYAVTPTAYATDAYCFRVTNAGSELDFYGTVAELGLQFDPSFSAVTLNDGLDISLTPGTTTLVIASTSITDLNGYLDIEHATATIYRSGAGAACTPNSNDCYVLSTDAGSCSLSGCDGNSCSLICSAAVAFHADPTDAETLYEGQEWLAYVEVEDASAGYDFASAPGVELLTLRAMQVDSLINYGALEANTNTGSSNASTTITNLGNIPINVDVEATDLSDGGVSVIPAEQQKVATSTFTYSACVTCYQLSSSTPVTLGLNLSKPTTVTPPVETDVYWGIAVPLNINSAPHTGVNIFTAIGVD
jgi:Domain of unknown function (DUF2341)